MLLRRLVETAVVGVVLVVGMTCSAHAWPTQVSGYCVNESPDGVYWSGTEAEIWGHWRNPQGIKKIELWVNQIRLHKKEWTSNYPTEWPPVVGTWCVVPFSTTNWDNNTVITLKATLTSRNGVYEQVTDSTHKTLNKGWAVGNITEMPYSTWPLRAGYAVSFLANAHHQTSDATDWFSSEIEGTLIPRGTVFHDTSHGDSTSFGDAYALAGSGDEHYTDLLELSTAVGRKSVYDCQLNFVFLDTCNSAYNDDLYHQSHARSYAGWNGGQSDDEDYRKFLQGFYASLGGQATVYNACLAGACATDGRVTNWRIYGSSGYRVYLTNASM